MWIEKVVINASPLITLFRANLHPLLPQLFPEVLVPDAVWAEVVNRTHGDPATRGLPKADWAIQRSVVTRPEVTAWGLGAGETAVLSFALQNPGYAAVIDDRQARRCAQVLNLAIMGTAAVVVLARRRGLIDSTENALRRLQDAGLWLSEALITRLAADDTAK